MVSGHSAPSGAPALRFAIIIPAHDEERYLPATLEHVRALNYPSDRYQAIVVENGSSDRTMEVAQRFEGPNIQVLSVSTSGVSAAKNAGIEQLSPDVDWVVFLDADTILEPEFLNELAAFLQSSTKVFSVGTTDVLPLGGGRKARMWLGYWNVLNRLGGSFAIQIIRRSLLSDLRFDENLTMGEDLLLIKQARKFGKFFHLTTRTVFTSTRRFDEMGYWKLAARWSFVGALPRRYQAKFGYKPVR